MTIATNDRARLFLMPRGANNALSETVYIACIGSEGLTQDAGEINKIECPDPNGVGYKEVGTYRGEKGRMTTSWSYRLSLSELSFLRELFDGDCPVDAHIHWGACENLDDLNQYSIGWILKNVYITNWGTDPVIAMQSADRNPVNETVDVSIGEFYQIKSDLVYASRASGLTATGLVIDAVVCSRRSCASDLCPPSPGCDKVYAITADDYIEYSSDNGATWTSIQIPVANRGTDPIAIACSGRGITVVYDDGVVTTIGRSEIDLIKAGTLDPDTDTFIWRSSSLGFDIVAVTDGSAMGVAGLMILSDTGELYRTIDRNDPSCGVTLIDSSAETFAATATGDGVQVMVGTGGVVYSYQPGTSLVAATAPTSEDLYAVVVKTKRTWLVGGDNGELWKTDNGGITWTQICFPGYNAGTPPTVTDLCMSNDHVVWMVAGGVLYRSIDGGNTWVYEPNSTNAARQIALRNLGTFSGLACCDENPNLVWAYGSVGEGDPQIVVGLSA